MLFPSVSSNRWKMRLLLILSESDKREIEILDGDPCLQNLVEFEATVADRLQIMQLKFLMIFAPFWDEFVNLDDISKLHDKAKIKVII